MIGTEAMKGHGASPVLARESTVRWMFGRNERMDQRVLSTFKVSAANLKMSMSPLLQTSGSGEGMRAKEDNTYVPQPGNVDEL